MIWINTMSNEKIIFTNGCWDLLHVSHIRLLQYCKSLGYVVVGLNSDRSVRELKGPSRPINNENDRKEMLLALKYVDEVHIFDEPTPYELIKKIKPDIIVKGGDYNQSNVVGSDLAKVLIFNYIDGYSTTKIIEKIKTR